MEIVTTRPLISCYAVLFSVIKSARFGKNGDTLMYYDTACESMEREFDIFCISPRRYLFRAYISHVIFGGHALARATACALLLKYHWSLLM